MQNFTPITALLGGTLIGISAVLMLYLHGRITGISGIAHGLFPVKRGDFLWRIIFLFGLISAGIVYYAIPAIQFTPRPFYPWSLLIIAGALVALGTKISGGCTSGHGVCGLARFSKRSMLATAIFLVSGFITVFIIRHGLHSI